MSKLKFLFVAAAEAAVADKTVTVSISITNNTLSFFINFFCLLIRLPPYWNESSIKCLFPPLSIKMNL